MYELRLVVLVLNSKVYTHIPIKHTIRSRCIAESLKAEAAGQLLDVPSKDEIVVKGKRRAYPFLRGVSTRHSRFRSLPFCTTEFGIV